MRNQELTPGLIDDFKQHVVWQTILKRIEGPRSAAHNRAINSDDTAEHCRYAGEYRAYEMVCGLPDQLLREIEGSGTIGSRLKTALGR